MCLADLLLGRAASLAQLKSTGGLDLLVLLATIIVVQVVLHALPVRGIQTRLRSRAFWGSLRVWLGVLAADVVAIGILLALGFGNSELLRNGDFRQGKLYWGSGFYEDLLRNGRNSGPAFNKALAHFPFVLGLKGPSPEFLPSGYADVDYEVARPRTFPYLSASPSYRIELALSPVGGREEQFGTLAQRLGSLKPGTDYAATYWIMIEHMEPGAIIVTTRLDWNDRQCPRPDRIGHWEQKTCKFNTENFDQVDLRFVVRNAAKFWVSDISVKQRS
jgi:hypothetical protein